MYIMLPPLSVLNRISESKNYMFVGPTPHQLFVSAPGGSILMIVVEENLNEMSPEEVNLILQREIALAQ